MKDMIINAIGWILDILKCIYCAYQRNFLTKRVGYIGFNSSVSYPNLIQGHKNIEIEENAYIGPNSIITAINAKVKVKKYSVIATFIYLNWEP